MNNLSLCFWNIGCVRNKLENGNILCLLKENNIIWLAELKTDLSIHLPGFTFYRNTTRYPNHRGICMFVNNALVKYINFIKFDKDDGIWITFIQAPNTLFGGYYVSPDDSVYYEETVFPLINSQLLEFFGSCVLLGDFNAKIADFNNICYNSKFRYPVRTPNPRNISGDILTTICQSNDLIILNGLQNELNFFDGGPTFRKKENWISLIDLCIVSSSLIQNIDMLHINRNLNLTSDHAIINIGIKIERRHNTKTLKSRSNDRLPDYECEYYKPEADKFSFDKSD